MKKLVLIFIIVLHGAGSLGYEIIFDRVSARAGLKSDYVYCVGQGADGFIWVGTQSGLQRYDGYRMASFFGGNTKGQLPPKPIEQILQAPQANLIWVRTGNTVGLFDTRKFSYTAVSVKNADLFNISLYQNNNHKTYILQKGGEILSYNKNRRRFETDVSMNQIPGGFGPQAMQLLSNGDFYLAGKDGLGYFDARNNRFYTASYNPQENRILQATRQLKWIRVFFLDSKGRSFIQTWPPRKGQELFMLSPDAMYAKRVPVSPMQAESYYGINEISEHNGKIWATGGGIFNIFDEVSKFEGFYNHKNSVYGISSSHIFQLFGDKDNNLWVATNNGLYMAFVVGNYMRNASVDGLFGNHDQTSILEIGKKHFLLGSWGGGIAAFHYDNEKILSPDHALVGQIYAGRPSGDENFKMVWDMAKTAWGNLVIGCQHGRVIFFDQLKKKSVFAVPGIFAGQTVRQVEVDREGKVWFGTQGGKIICYDRGKYEQVLDLKSIISKLYMDKAGDIWIATSGKGLIKCSAIGGVVLHKYTTGPVKNSISSNQITDVTQLNDSLMAIACDANLDLLNLKNGKIFNFNPYSGLEQNIIGSLAADRKGYLWMTSNGGVVRLDVRRMRLRYYDQKDGMVNTSNQDNLMHISRQLNNGDLYFGSNQNFMILNPDSLNRKFIPKDAMITGFRVFDNYIPIAQLKKNGVISLTSKQNVFTIQFSSLSYKQTRQLKYFYRLEGASDTWLQVENGQSASFASLSPGKYTFMVYVVNQEEIRSPGITTLQIEIIPEFYQTRWFMFLIIILCLLPVFIIYRLRVRRTMEVYRLREKVARDLHDDMGSTLTSINILSEVAQRGLQPGQEDTLECIKKISHNSSQMMESMDDIVWSIKPDNDQLSRIMVRLREHATQILEPQDINYEFIADEQVPLITLSMEARRNLFLIYKEALNNISKYAVASYVSIKLLHQNRQILLSVKDNGKGFDTAILSEGNGLMNMRKRAELMNGFLTIDSVIGGGTHIVLSIPADR